VKGENEDTLESVENKNTSGVDMAETDCDNLVGMIVNCWTCRCC